MMDEHALAFNEGSNARMAGIPRELNPYVGTMTPRRSWDDGWDDMNGNWGRWVRGRWPHQSLPAVT